ncbi:Fanconi anemia group F protein [Mixophyes fleayi]|uniref:Fanconi anemia group F protein n=1 Tax=Mixophyes fleayi TaxID=3061075 RepID=UPI003F4DC0D7
MSGKMNTMLENLDHFIEVLALIQSAHVKDWDVLNVQRALEWGSYFQHVHHQFKANISLRNVIEDHLNVKNEELRLYMKNYQHITFNDLGRGKAILCMSLLQNKAVPIHVLKHLLELLRDSDSKAIESLGLQHIISQKAASELFLLLPLFVSDGHREPLDNPVVKTQADILKNMLESRLKVFEDNQKLSVVSDVLSGISQPLVYHLIAVVLTTHGALSSSHQDCLAELLLDWLLSNDVSWTGFCLNASCQVLASLSLQCSKFRNAYLDCLFKLGGGMEQDLSGSWVSNAPQLSFDGLIRHFRCLMKGPEDLRDITVTRLHTLKSQDGDYEEPAISIWTDLLIEIHKS